MCGESVTTELNSELELNSHHAMDISPQGTWQGRALWGIQSLLLSDVDPPNLHWSYGELQVPTELREGIVLDAALLWETRGALAWAKPGQKAGGAHCDKWKGTRNTGWHKAPHKQIYIFLLSNMFC